MEARSTKLIAGPSFAERRWWHIHDFRGTDFVGRIPVTGPLVIPAWALGIWYLVLGVQASTRLQRSAHEALRRESDPDSPFRQ
jgi:hypothetical protein